MASDYLSNFYAVAKQLTIPPKTILLEEGKVADKLYLIRKGCLRLFFYNDGKDITFQFFFEGDFVASFDSLYKRTPSLFYLESIEPAEVAAIKRNDFYAIIKDDPRWRQAYEEKLIDYLMVFDWNGNPVACYESDKPLTKIYYQEDENVVYGVSIADDGAKLYKFQLL